MKKILLIICLFPILVFSQKSYKIPADSTILNNIGSGKNELVIRNATSGVTNGVLTNLGNGVTAFVVSATGVTQSTLNDSISSVRAIRKVDTLYRNSDSLVFKINGVRYSIKDSSGTSGTTVSSYGKNTGKDSTVLVLSDGTRYAAKDSIGVNTDAQTLSLSYTDSITLAISGGNSIKFAYAMDSVVVVGDSLITIKAGVRRGYSIGTYTLTKNTTRDSIYLNRNGVLLSSVKDSTGGGGSSGWALTGNSGTDSSTNFIGTTDANPLLFRTNNLSVMKMDILGKVTISPTTTLGFSNALTLSPKASNIKHNTTFDMADSSIYVGLNSYFDGADWRAAQPVGSYIRQHSTGLLFSISSGNTINGVYTNSATTKSIMLFPNGNVTVGGTTDLGYRLNSNCSTNGFDGMLIQNSSSGGSNKGGIMFYNGNTNLTSLIYKAGSSFTTVADRNTLFVESGEANGIAVSASNASGYIKFLQNSTERMRIHSNGNVGIGTASPSANASLEITTTTKAPIKLTPMTAAQASALTAEDGQIVYVSTTDATFTAVGLWGRENGVWVKQGSSTTPDVVLISTVNASGAATIEFTGLSSTYNKYIVELSGIYPSVNNSKLYMQMGTGATPTWASGATDYVYINATSFYGDLGGGAVASLPYANAQAAQIALYQYAALKNDVVYALNGSVQVFNPSNSASYKVAKGDFSFFYQNIYVADARTTGTYKATTAVTAIKLYMDTGNITGTAKLYGYK